MFSQNYPKSIFLNASIKVEASFLQFGYNYSILLIKSSIFHSICSNRTIVLTRAKGSNRITLMVKEINEFENCHLQYSRSTLNK